MNWYLEVLRKYFVFSGRARRKEFWMFSLIHVIIVFVLAAIDLMVLGAEEGSMGILSSLYTIAVFIPSVAVTVRRLHDSGRTGWWWLVSFVPFIGFIIVLIFMVLDSQPGENEYGPNPKELAYSY